MLQPLGGRTASRFDWGADLSFLCLMAVCFFSILAEEIISQYIDPKGPNCVSTLSPATRTATLERWAQIGKDYSRLQRTFFDTCRSEVERGELAELTLDYKAYQARLEQETASLKSKSLGTGSGDTLSGDSTGSRSVFGSVLSSIRKSTGSFKNDRIVPAAERSLDKVSSSPLPPAASSLSSSPAAHSSAPEPVLPLSVQVAAGEGGLASLQVDLVAAETHLSWTVERSWAEVKQL